MASSLVAHQSLSAPSFNTAVKGVALSANRVAVAPIIAPRGLGFTALLGFNKAAVPAKTAPVKKQLRTEDGIFGTSGGFGFTRANELFVGRVAMLGFAASLLGEAVTGQGILSHLNLETGIPITEAEPLLLFFITFTVIGAIGGLGDRGRFVDDEAPAGPPVKLGSAKAALGLSEEGPLFGFTKANELFVGRMAQLGFAASLVGEVITGRGALAQLNIETGLPVWELEPLLLASIAFFFIAAINPVEQVRSQVEQVRSQVEQVRSQVEQVRSQVEQVRSQVEQVRSQVEQVRSQVEQFLGCHLTSHLHLFLLASCRLLAISLAPSLLTSRAADCQQHTHVNPSRPLQPPNALPSSSTSLDSSRVFSPLTLLLPFSPLLSTPLPTVIPRLLHHPYWETMSSLQKHTFSLLPSILAIAMAALQELLLRALLLLQPGLACLSSTKPSLLPASNFTPSLPHTPLATALPPAAFTPPCLLPAALPAASSPHQYSSLLFTPLACLLLALPAALTDDAAPRDPATAVALHGAGLGFCAAAAAREAEPE
ncbi:unnamed protein product [Closterium sp. Naga37s-1]|nr:unnamed protein product [Closterium sp. Naga37s-1]